MTRIIPVARPATEQEKAAISEGFCSECSAPLPLPVVVFDNESGTVAWGECTNCGHGYRWEVYK